MQGSGSPVQVPDAALGNEAMQNPDLQQGMQCRQFKERRWVEKIIAKQLEKEHRGIKHWENAKN